MKRLVILGGGESGVGTAILAKQKGWSVFLPDRGALKSQYRDILSRQNIGYEEGFHDGARILAADCIMKSPGAPDEVGIIKKAREKQTPIISEIEFAGQYTHSIIVTITGSNDETTTTLLTHHIFKQAGLEVGLGGNIGYSLAELVAHSNPPHYVLEISSSQLDGIEHFAPHIAVLLNITSDRLDRYDHKFESYIASKFHITMSQAANDYFIYDVDDPVINDWLTTHSLKSKCIGFSIEKGLSEGAFLKDNKIHIVLEDQTTVIDVEEISLKGKHNIKDTMAAAIAARLVDIRNASLRESPKGFQEAAHHLEEVKVVEGVAYINDSKATNANSVYFALDTIKTPIVWIVGEQDEGNDYNSLLPYVHQKVKAIVCSGIDSTPILQSFYNVINNMVETRPMEEAVKMAQRFATAGDTTLLSPACASFNLFKSYEDRGDQLKAAVAKL